MSVDSAHVGVNGNGRKVLTLKMVLDEEYSVLLGNSPADLDGRREDHGSGVTEPAVDVPMLKDTD